MATHLEPPAAKTRKAHARGESRGSDYVLDIASGDNVRSFLSLLSAIVRTELIVHVCPDRLICQWRVG